jgi:predicted Zn-dependent protease
LEVPGGVDVRTIVLAAILMLCSFATAVACGSFAADDAAVARVQSSWGPAEQMMAKGQYASALEMLQSSQKYLPLIRNTFIRSCVAEGADLRIVSARAGQEYLAGHPGDAKGAATAADRAWRAFPQRHDCP